MTVYLNRTHLILFLIFFFVTIASSYMMTTRAHERLISNGFTADLVGVSFVVTHPVGWVYVVFAVGGPSLMTALVVGTLLGVFRKP